MQSDAVVEADDVLDEIALRLAMISVIALPNALHFQIQKEALHYGIGQSQHGLDLAGVQRDHRLSVPTIPLAAHAAADSVLTE
jgi:hypothetical protein